MVKMLGAWLQEGVLLQMEGLGPGTTRDARVIQMNQAMQQVLHRPDSLGLSRGN